MLALSHHRTTPPDLRRRRAIAEADEIAAAAPHYARMAMEHGTDPLRRAPRPDEIIRRHGGADADKFGQNTGIVELHREVQRTNILVVSVLLLAAVTGFVIGWLTDTSQRAALLDFIAPTAAQARDMGWVAISERQ